MSATVPSTAGTADVWGDAAGLSRRQLLVDLGIGGLVTVLGAVAQASYSPWSTAAAVLLGVALALRRLWWPAMVALGFVAAVIQVVSTDLAAVPDAVYAPLFFSLGAHRDPRVRRLGLVCAVVAILVAGVWAGAFQLKGTRSVSSTLAIGGAFAAVTAVFTGGGWAAGVLRWQRRQAVQARVDAELSAVEGRRTRDLFEQEQERGRIAADVHDLAAHSWAVVAAMADGARYRLDTDPEDARQALEVIGETARSAMTDVRALLAQLRESGSGADALGFEQQEVLLGQMRASGMELDVEQHGEAPESSLLVMSTRRVLAEALTNALKHGDLSRPVQVHEDWRHGYRLRVVNATRPSSVRGTGGHGLLGMTERMALVGGRVTARREGDEWVVSAEVAEP